MTTALRIRKGKVLLSEAAVTRAIDDFMRAERYVPIKTHAECMTRAGFPSLRRGHPDRVYVHPERPAIFAELKRSCATTSKKRKAAQAEFQQEMQAKGFKCYRADDSVMDQIGAFQQWYREVVTR